MWHSPRKFGVEGKKMPRQAQKSFRTQWISGVLAVVAPIVILSGCGINNNNNLSGTGSVSGTVTDSDGTPIAGATVVAGGSSPTAMTDQDGKFTLTGVPAGSTTINAITPDYETDTVMVFVNENKSTPVPDPIRLPDVDDVANAPEITDVTLSPTASTILVTATIKTGASGDGLSDARAELIGYGVGAKMTANGSTFSATIAIPGGFAGPSALVEVFAIDNKRRVGAQMATAPISGVTGSGDFDAATFTGDWAGSAEFHRAAFGDSDRVGDRRIANVSLSISGGAVSGRYVDFTLEKYIPATSWGVTTTGFTGSLTLIDANRGIYKIESTFNPAASRTVDLTVIGKLNSATAPSHFVGFLRAVVRDTSPMNVTTIIRGRIHLLSGLNWSTSDLEGDWVWSQLAKSCPTCGAGFTYRAPFQFNSSFTVAAGTISGGEDTLGNAISTSVPFSVTDSGVGVFSGTLTSTDGSTITVSGLIGPRKRHLFGLFSVALSGKTAYGLLWGNRIAAPPHFATSDFGQKQFDGSTRTAIWRGFFYVSGGPDPAGTICYLSLWTKPDGSVVGGAIAPVPLMPCPLVVFRSGDLAFLNTTDGQISGSATGGTRVFTLAPESSRNASMGVEKARLVGDFSLNVTGGLDTGFFFLARTFVE
jgi:Carboxypeptidase regulatory-like domain